MEKSFPIPDQAPLPPDQVRVVALSAAPWPDGRRVRLGVALTPFQQRPNLHLRILDERGREVAAMIVPQLLQTQIELTLHLRQPDTAGQYTAAAYLAYPDLDLDRLGQAEVGFEIP